ncbi:MAG: ABC transporter permease [Acidimicrobiales bacterium]|nr:ABC transporter permease [Acidimicrobiales bacterium]MCB1259796.1 ABC transporter permease [Acidimicrobiales bacterium]
MSAPAPSGAILAAQVRNELRLSLRQGEQLLVSLGIPLLLLVFFSLVDVLPVPDGVTEPVDFLAPGILALAVMSTAMVSLGIGTGFDRQYKVLKRLGVSPLGRTRLVVAKIAMVLVVEAIQVVLISATAFALGWRPSATAALAVPAVLAGTAAFAGIGLLMAGTLKGTLTLALANGLYLVLLLLGGMIIPLESLPAPLEAVARLLPAAALSEVLGASLTSGDAASAQAWTVLVVWAVAAPVVAAARFRWE